MRSSIARRILEKTPKHVEVFVGHTSALVIRINQILETKGMSQKDLAEKMGKKPSEISKWLSGTHNMTMLSIAKLEVALNESLVHIPVQHRFQMAGEKAFSMTVAVKNTPFKESDFLPAKPVHSPKVEKAA